MKATLAVAVIAEVIIKCLLFIAKLFRILEMIFIGRPRLMLIIVILRGWLTSIMVTAATTIEIISISCAWFVADSDFFSFLFIKFK